MYYPIFLDVRGRRCLVFGGNPGAARKAGYLKDCGADVMLYSPEEDTLPELADLAAQDRIAWARRGYRPGDLKGAWVAIVADTSDLEVNLAIANEAKERNVLLNVMDVTHQCTFIAPAVIHRAETTVAISTGGGSPALARRLRERMSDTDYCQCLRWAELGPMLRDVRGEVRGRALPVTPEDWATSITDEILRLHEAGDRDGARSMLVSALEARAGIRAGE
ncbi:MAG: bifunctional precorrin-2 dehydrogenase/sirohydrochlorin ferrochelatase [Dehalococcoidia bacterium]